MSTAFQVAGGIILGAHQPPNLFANASSMMQPSQRRHMSRNLFLSELSQYVRKLLEKLTRTIEPESRLLSFGSTANGFSLRNSDMDLCCLIDSDQPPLAASDLVTMLGDLLERETKFHVKPLPYARIPIIKLSLGPSQGLPYGIACDIGFENRLALENTRLLLSYASVDPTRVRTMVLFLKVWSKRRKINSPYRGTLSSYGYVLLVIYFLVHVKNPPVLPNLQQIPPLRPISHEDMHFGEHNIWFFDDIELLRQRWRSSNTQSVAELLIDFFKYYSRDFSYNTGVASIRAGLLKKESKGWLNDFDGSRYSETSRDRNRLCIEDPFETNYNVARTVTKDGLYTIRGEFMRASRILATRPERAINALAQLCEERDEELVRATPTRSFAPPPPRLPAQMPYTIGSSSLRPNKGAPVDRLSPPPRLLSQTHHRNNSQEEVVERHGPPPEHMAPRRGQWTSPPPPDAPPSDQDTYECTLGLGLTLATQATEARQESPSYSESSNSEILTDDDAQSEIIQDTEYPDEPYTPHRFSSRRPSAPSYFASPYTPIPTNLEKTPVTPHFFGGITPTSERDQGPKRSNRIFPGYAVHRGRPCSRGSKSEFGDSPGGYGYSKQDMGPDLPTPPTSGGSSRRSTGQPRSTFSVSPSSTSPLKPWALPLPPSPLAYSPAMSTASLQPDVSPTSSYAVPVDFPAQPPYFGNSQTSRQHPFRNHNFPTHNHNFQPRSQTQAFPGYYSQSVSTSPTRGHFYGSPERQSHMPGHSQPHHRQKSQSAAGSPVWREFELPPPVAHVKHTNMPPRHRARPSSLQFTPGSPALSELGAAMAGSDTTTPGVHGQEKAVDVDANVGPPATMTLNSPRLLGKGLSAAPSPSKTPLPLSTPSSYISRTPMPAVQPTLPSPARVCLPTLAHGSTPGHAPVTARHPLVTASTLISTEIAPDGGAVASGVLELTAPSGGGIQEIPMLDQSEAAAQIMDDAPYKVALPPSPVIDPAPSTADGSFPEHLKSGKASISSFAEGPMAGLSDLPPPSLSELEDALANTGISE
ncbi:hypothetical protein BOTBODRAFT_220517 [Botryobasidium botryosum FD-172 SS1]|uniref:polynucleotide adenylyltransferase n=1 Tax=Botryobasidium botryosum (strain FD-172 SS1) TaxID=930990 RepID=A0A067MYH4_BOTB1|nr:hypothetical protein BOTBODRAFT_220517 [Botryobasidium botryosum FD-172 SS1]